MDPEPLQLLFTLFVATPSIAAAIGYAAWKGRPKSFDRESYVLGFVACILASGLLLVYAERMQADVGTRQYPLQVACSGLGVLLFGAAAGCGIGIFTYRFRSLTREPTMDDYQEQWRTYKRLRSNFLLMWLFYVPVCDAAFLVSLPVFGRGSSISIIITATVAFAWVGLFLRLARRLRQWNCPRCHRTFEYGWKGKGIFTSNCANCGLPRYSN